MIQIKVDLKVFPLTTIKSALYVLSDRLDSRLEEDIDDNIVVTLKPIAGAMTPSEIEQTFNQTLIAASVNEQAWQRTASIRNYLAQTAFSITVQNQQTIEEFVASIAEKQDQEHAGAPAHTTTADSPTKDDPFTPTQSDNGVLVDAENGHVVLRINTRKYLLPDVLWAANETKDICDCSISNQPDNRLIVQLKPCQHSVELAALSATFEHWLEMAGECLP
jgi:His-Xaa-Ser system protein HxsD